MTAKTLERIAERVLAFDEDELNSLLNHFKKRMEQGELSPEWERAVIAYFLINGVRVKNALKHGRMVRKRQEPGKFPPLRLIKA